MISAEDVVDRWSKFEKKVAKLPAEKILGLVEKVGNLCKDKELTLTQIQNLGAGTLVGWLLGSASLLTGQVMLRKGERHKGLYYFCRGCGTRSELEIKTSSVFE